MLKAFPEFCYLGNMLSAGSDCELAVVIRCECLRRKFCQLLPLTINCNLLVLTDGLMYSTGVRRVMLHATETQVMTVATLSPLQHNDGSVMARQRMKLPQHPFSQSLTPGLGTWWCSKQVG